MRLMEELTKERGTSKTMLASKILIIIGFITFLPIFILSFFLVLNEEKITYLMILGFAIFLLIPYWPYQRWLKIQYETITNYLSKIISGITIFIIGIVVVAVAMWVGQKVLTKTIEIITPDSWNLMICNEVMSNGVECLNNKYVLEGYGTQRECMEKGIELANPKGFECGKNCKDDSEWGSVCEIICNSRGCM